MASLSKEEILAYRIADIRFPLFDGTGASLLGGRWNSPGMPAIYASRSYACAMVEKMAQLGSGKMPRHQAWIRIHGKAVSMETLSPSALPGWSLEDQIASRAYGDNWLLAKRSLILIVPSVVAPEDHNIVINPAHPEFKKLTYTEPKPVHWDRRLFGEGEGL